MRKRATDSDKDKGEKDSDTTTEKDSGSTGATSAGGASGAWKPLTAAQKKHVYDIYLHIYLDTYTFQWLTNMQDNHQEL
jgi:hypothetical protein